MGTATFEENKYSNNKNNPSNENAHPNTDCHNKVAIIYNGVITNFKELKNKLIEKGHEFS